MLDQKPLDAQCKATFKRTMTKPTTFKVEVLPGTHADHLKGVSAWLPIGIK